jgi:hypothetical protein
LKENVIMGKLIPAGTGAKHYRTVRITNGDTTNGESNGYEPQATATATYIDEMDGEE